MKKKLTEETIKRVHRVLSAEQDKFVINKSQKIREKESEIIKQYKALQEERAITGPAALSEMQEKFVDVYCARYGEKSATACAIDAGYNVKGAHNRASELMNYQKNPHVVLEIQSRLAMLREQWDIDRDKHLAMLTKIRDEARIKGQYGVVAKCEELRGKVGGLYIEKSMVLTKDISDNDGDARLKLLYKNRDDFDKAMLIMGDELFPGENSDLYGEVDIQLSKKEKAEEKKYQELEKYQEDRARERNRYRDKK